MGCVGVNRSQVVWTGVWTCTACRQYILHEVFSYLVQVPWAKLNTILWQFLLFCPPITTYLIIRNYLACSSYQHPGRKSMVHEAEVSAQWWTETLKCFQAPLARWQIRSCYQVCDRPASDDSVDQEKGAFADWDLKGSPLVHFWHNLVLFIYYFVLFAQHVKLSWTQLAAGESWKGLWVLLATSTLLRCCQVVFMDAFMMISYRPITG